MNKAGVASLLAVSATLLVPGMVSNFGVALAQAAAAPAAGQVQMDPKEYAVYDDAVNKQTTPQTQAPALEAYLTSFPNSAVKADVLQRLMLDYSQFDPAKAITTADKVLQLDPNNLRADLIEVAFRRQAAETQTDATARQAGLDAAVTYAQKGLTATKPTGMSDADFTTLQAAAIPAFQSVIGTAALSKKDTATAITAFKAELAASKPEDTTKPGTALQDTYYLGQAYYQSTPPDLVNCTFYATRAFSYAPPQFQAQMPLAAYCYKKYHGGTDGYDAVTTAAKANLNPPSGFTIVAAPSDADIAAKTVASTPDLASLALSDKEFIMKNGKSEDAEKVFATIKGKTVQIPDALVIAATADDVQVAVSDDAVQGKAADFDFKMKTPLTKVPEVGSKINLAGTYDSYTQSPVMITMSDSDVVTKKAPAAATHHTTTTHHK
ncbi:hypothetical protein [Granulicella tundricola]|uniref:Putative lipoprotein n=1 Tax=Granulicella tundricola (strain ATCC BAA-1859 / DSM 23138 / MP5ACTX9) TaxID=1198114 RepID=E8X4P9_GRATM|nr:hypothetical protein [Granulicella tundricola]ADW69459.1 putative lipoprotein [Granulicella tundricola MP5ACTX9]